MIDGRVEVLAEVGSSIIILSDDGDPLKRAPEYRHSIH